MSTYIVSPTLYRRELGDKALLFNSAKSGNPILAQSTLARLLDQCREPISEDKLLGYLPATLSPEDRAGLFSFLRHYCLQEFPATTPQSLPPHSLLRSISVWLHLTNDCNLRCPYCFVTKTKAHATKVTLRKIIRTLLDGAQKRGYSQITIKFAGGEPLLAFDTLQYVVDLCEREKGSLKVHYAVLSNGTRLDESCIAFLKEHRIGIGISMDGYGEVHNRTRKDACGKGTFEVIAANIARLQEQNLSPFIMGTFSQETIASLPALTEWLLDRCVFSRYNFVRDNNQYSIGDYRPFCRDIIRYTAESIGVIQRHPFGPTFLLHWKLADLSFASPIERQPCGIARSHFVIGHRGQIALCPMTLDHPIGALENDPFAVYQRYEQHYNQQTPVDACCQMCPWHRVCGTGCPTLNESHFGHPNKRSPFCLAYRKLIPLYIDAYGWALEQLASTGTS